MKRIKYLQLVMDSLKNSFVIKTPNMMFEQKRQTLDLKSEKLKEILNKKINDKKLLLNHIKKNHLLNNPSVLIENYKLTLNKEIEKLELLNPLSTLKRGYSITYINDNVVKTIENVKVNDILNVHVTDGVITSKILEVKKNG
jgi:exodeoxyribonuclease VII large subunit